MYTTSYKGIYLHEYIRPEFIEQNGHAIYFIHKKHKYCFMSIHAAKIKITKLLRGQQND